MHRLFLLPLAGLLVACGGDTAPAATPSPVVIVVTAPPIVITAPPIVITATPLAATATLAIPPTHLPTATSVPPTKPPTPHATDTPAPPTVPFITVTPYPPTPAPHLNSTLTLDHWVISIPKYEVRSTIDYSDYMDFVPSGKYWVIWLDAKNTSPAGRTLGDDLTWHLIDDQGGTYPEISHSYANRYEMGQFANRNDRRPLDVNVAPRTTTHVFLAFDVAADAKSGTLHLTGDGIDGELEIALHK